EHAPQIRCCQALPPGWAVGRACQAQYPLGMDIAIERVHRDFTASAARSDDGDFAIEGDQLLVQERCRAQSLPGSLYIFLCSYHRLPFAVIAETPCLDERREADGACCTRELGPRTNRVPARCRDPQTLEQFLLTDTILGSRQRGNRRSNPCRAVERA